MTDARQSQLDASGIAALQCELLGQVVPSVVHDLNNSLSVMRGVLELIAHDTDDASARHAIKESVSASKLLAVLSIYAKGDREGLGVQDPAQLINRVTSLLRALATSLAVQLQVSAPEGQAILSTGPRSFSRQLLTLGLVLIRSAKVAGLRSRVRLRMKVQAESVVLRFVASTSGADEALVGACIAGFLGEVEGATEVRRHRTQSARSIELRLPAQIAKQATLATDQGAAGAQSQRVLLFGLETFCCEELGEVLRESGYGTVERQVDGDVEGTLRTSAADLALIDARILQGNPHLLQRIQAGDITPSLRVIILGEGAHCPGVRTLPNPCPPGELLSAIAEELN
ncbi:MAG: hypothetical protein ACI8QS_000386 [Planctomycetota bacterium]